MKKVFTLLIAAAATCAATAQTKVTDVAKFNLETIDLGKVKQGEPATATFEITNISPKPLVIEQANPTCGCTIADYTKAPIPPGEKGIVKATYNSAGAGSFYKTVTVKFAGVDETHSLTLTGEVLAPAKE